MKLFLYFLIPISYFLLSASPIAALYDPRTVPNNKVGIHVLSPDEIDTAATLVNSHGGDWGYITVPIQPTDRDLPKWQKFMEKCSSLHLIPLIRITTIPQGGTWEKGQDTDLVDFANFLDELSWPVENRYIILFNEVNRDAEWGGTVNPAKYAEIVKNARTIFKERSADFFLLGPALDDALPNSSSSLSAVNYLSAMYAHDPAIWSYFDGYAFHSYPNPGFSAPPTRTGMPSIVSYRYLFTRYKLSDKPVFITETGYDQTKVSGDKLNSYWQKAWEIWQADPKVAGVTPFLLEGGEQFKGFSLNSVPELYTNLPKTAGVPKLGTKSPDRSADNSYTHTGLLSPWTRFPLLFELENIVRTIFGLPQKTTLQLNDQSLIVELAETPKQWEKGLSNRASLSGADGMLFVFPSAHVPIFWMKNTHFPLDIIWIKDNLIVEITPSVPVEVSDSLPTYSPQIPVNAVLELPAGYAAQNNLKPGDQIAYD